MKLLDENQPLRPTGKKSSIEFVRFLSQQKPDERYR